MFEEEEGMFGSYRFKIKRRQRIGGKCDMLVIREMVLMIDKKD